MPGRGRGENRRQVALILAPRLLFLTAKMTITPISRFRRRQPKWWSDAEGRERKKADKNVPRIPPSVFTA